MSKRKEQLPYDKVLSDVAGHEISAQRKIHRSQVKAGFSNNLQDDPAELFTWFWNSPPFKKIYYDSVDEIAEETEPNMQFEKKLRGSLHESMGGFVYARTCAIESDGLIALLPPRIAELTYNFALIRYRNRPNASKGVLGSHYKPDIILIDTSENEIEEIAESTLHPNNNPQVKRRNGQIVNVEGYFSGKYANLARANREYPTVFDARLGINFITTKGGVVPTVDEVAERRQSAFYTCYTYEDLVALAERVYQEYSPHSSLKTLAQLRDETHGPSLRQGSQHIFVPQTRQIGRLA